MMNQNIFKVEEEVYAISSRGLYAAKCKQAENPNDPVGVAALKCADMNSLKTNLPVARKVFEEIFGLGAVTDIEFGDLLNFVIEGTYKKPFIYKDTDVALKAKLATIDYRNCSDSIIRDCITAASAILDSYCQRTIDSSKTGDIIMKLIDIISKYQSKSSRNKFKIFVDWDNKVMATKEGEIKTETTDNENGLLVKYGNVCSTYDTREMNPVLDKNGKVVSYSYADTAHQAKIMAHNCYVDFGNIAKDMYDNITTSEEVRNKMADLVDVKCPNYNALRNINALYIDIVKSFIFCKEALEKEITDKYQLEEVMKLEKKEQKRMFDVLTSMARTIGEGLTHEQRVLLLEAASFDLGRKAANSASMTILQEECIILCASEEESIKFYGNRIGDLKRLKFEISEGMPATVVNNKIVKLNNIDLSAKLGVFDDIDDGEYSIFYGDGDWYVGVLIEDYENERIQKSKKEDKAIFAVDYSTHNKELDKIEEIMFKEDKFYIESDGNGLDLYALKDNKKFWICKLRVIGRRSDGNLNMNPYIKKYNGIIGGFDTTIKTDDSLIFMISNIEETKVHSVGEAKPTSTESIKKSKEVSISNFEEVNEGDLFGSSSNNKMSSSATATSKPTIATPKAIDKNKDTGIEGYESVSIDDLFGL